MVFSLKANKNKLIAVVVLIGIIVCAVIFLPKMIQSPEDYSAATNEERVAFLESFGWEIDDDVMDSRDVTIPIEFSEIYTTYNVMQIAQGFDLEPYAGVTCKQYIYLVENYPEEGEVHATLLVYNDQIIGGDISCSEMNGFMHGFDSESAYYGEGSETYEMSEESLEAEDETEQTDAVLETDETDETSEIITDKSGEVITN